LHFGSIVRVEIEGNIQVLQGFLVFFPAQVSTVAFVVVLFTVWLELDGLGEDFDGFVEFAVGREGGREGGRERGEESVDLKCA
jgi:hypothetical protein